MNEWVKETKQRKRKSIDWFDIYLSNASERWKEGKRKSFHIQSSEDIYRNIESKMIWYNKSVC